ATGGFANPNLGAEAIRTLVPVTMTAAEPAAMMTPRPLTTTRPAIATPMATLETTATPACVTSPTPVRMTLARTLATMPTRVASPMQWTTTRMTTQAAPQGMTT